MLKNLTLREAGEMNSGVVEQGSSTVAAWLGCRPVTFFFLLVKPKMA